jgi:hypothetical protein
VSATTIENRPNIYIATHHDIHLSICHILFAILEKETRKNVTRYSIREPDGHFQNVLLRKMRKNSCDFCARFNITNHSNLALHQNKKKQETKKKQEKKKKISSHFINKKLIKCHTAHQLVLSHSSLLLQ